MNEELIKGHTYLLSKIASLDKKMDVEEVDVLAVGGLHYKLEAKLPGRNTYSLLYNYDPTKPFWISKSDFLKTYIQLEDVTSFVKE